MVQAHDNPVKPKLVNGQLHIDAVLIDDGVGIRASTCPHGRKNSLHSEDKMEAHVYFHILDHLAGTR